MPSPVPITHGEVLEDSRGYLYDAAMRRAIIETGGSKYAEVLEALAALRLAAKLIHDASERFAEVTAFPTVELGCSPACIAVRSGASRSERWPRA